MQNLTGITPAPDPTSLPVDSKTLTALASKLIDLTKRNRLLNAPTADPDRRGSLSLVPVEAPEMAAIFAWLSERERAVPIRPRAGVDPQAEASAAPEAAAQSAPASDPAPDAQPAVNPAPAPARPAKPLLISSYTEKKLTSALYNLRDRGRSSINERGVNILFAAFGMAEWADPSSAEDTWRSPVVLLPISVETRAGGYAIAGIHEETLVNPALAYKFQTEYGVTFPELGEDPEPADVETFLAALDALCDEQRPRFHGCLTVRREVNLGVFSFAKIAMFRELIQLGPENLLQNGVIAALVNSQRSPDFANDAPLPDLDQVFKPQSTYLVVEADSSQLEAVYRSQSGAHLAIQGPPGTGKSQTIVNLIADALSREQTVLFVAEKRVALDVVKNRLDRAGLGSACLVIHPGRAEGGEIGGAVNKKEVLTEIERAWSAAEPPVPPSAAADTLEELERVRAGLNQYVRELHQPRFAAAQSVFEIFGHLERLRDAPAVPVTVPDATQVTGADLSHRLALLDDFAEFQPLIDSTHLITPWADILPRPPLPNYQSALREHLETLNDLELELLHLLDELRETTRLAIPLDFAGIQFLADFCTHFQLDALAIEDAEELRRRFAGQYAGFFKFLSKKAYQADCARLKPSWLSAWTDDPHAIAAALEYFAKARAYLRVTPGFTLAANAHDLSAPAARLRELLASLKTEAAFFAAHFQPERLAKLGIAERADPATHAWARALLDSLAVLAPYANFRLVYDAADCQPLRAFIPAAVQAAIPAPRWRAAYERLAWESMLAAAYAASPLLAGFSGASHDRLVARFRELDRKHIDVSRRALALKIARSRPVLTGAVQRALSSEVAILTREFKKKRVKPLRRVFSEAMRIVQAIKPCFMMSPLTVSQYLDPDKVRFDVVIFDEASQIRMEDALGSIYRGKQVIIVGDEQQLPPTRFFDAVESGDDPDEDLEDAIDYESILTRAEGEVRAFHQVRLRWHYRSLSEELIAFSNKNFYENSLFTFPNPEQAGLGRALRFVPVPDGVYDRGRSRTNPIEARALAAACLDFAAEHPNWSLGVVTFSEAQRQMIEDEIDARLREAPERLAFFAEDRPGGEPFMVKNLELIQGDERDAIFFSFGYGHDQTGAFSQNFGPLNQEAGRRRLNVAVTRARRMVTVFSSIQPEELTAVHSEGVRLMKEYMTLARDGLAALFGSPTTAASRGEIESPLEAAVKERLEALGLTVHTQIGCSGYRIDLGILDPQVPGRYCLGVECDGAAYHSGRTARDRDRLRQQVLESLGWNILRIWSKSWSENPQREAQRVLDAVRQFSGRSLSPSPAAPAAPDPTPPAPDPAADAPLPAIPVQTVQQSFPEHFRAYRPYHRAASAAQYSLSMAVRDISELLKAQGPMRMEPLSRQVATLWGYARLGDNIRANVMRVVQQGARDGSLCLGPDPDFIYPTPPAPLAILTDTNGDRREIEDIPEEEIYLALVLAVRAAGGSVSAADAARIAADMLGFKRVTAEMSARFRLVLSGAARICASPYSAVADLIQTQGEMLVVE
ncbi:MAG TPA: DUF4011 domain-containing protein [Anaerolineaceae bacterium]